MQSNRRTLVCTVVDFGSHVQVSVFQRARRSSWQIDTLQSLPRPANKKKAFKFAHYSKDDATYRNTSTSDEERLRTVRVCVFGWKSSHIWWHTTLEPSSRTSSSLTGGWRSNVIELFIERLLLITIWRLSCPTPNKLTYGLNTTTSSRC